jgi:hypothetical protein
MSAGYEATFVASVTSAGLPGCSTFIAELGTAATAIVDIGKHQFRKLVGKRTRRNR